ncbi:MAG TPA: DivIVA domain-containing protein [Gaiellaceae bacterium]|jgi:cell division septum initiation protein DivIVA|nr:DivIVA domain-containing protein [Gaiellaceae bacterium]
MAYTPVELRHLSLRRGLLGYRRAAVDTLLSDVASSFEDVWRERADLADRVEEIESELRHHREREALLSNTLLAAERAAAESKSAAQHQAEQLVAEAHAEARAITRSAIAERERLLAEIRRIRALLHAVLDVVEEGEQPPETASEAAPEERPGGVAGEIWPRRDDTREFDAPDRPGLYLSADPEDAREA